MPTRIVLCYVPRHPGGYAVHALHLDGRTVLGPWVWLASLESLRRLLRYLGATPLELHDFEYAVDAWGQGSAFLTLAPDRKNLLRLRAPAAPAQPQATTA